MKKIILIGTLFGACIAFANPYSKCVTCHGASGEKVALGKSKVIKDMTKAEFIAALKGYKAGTYGRVQKVLMVNALKGVSDADIEAMAEQIAKK